MIILRKTNDCDFVEIWTTLKGLCKAHRDIKYYTVRYKKFPFEYRGYRFDKIEVNKKR